MPKKRQTSKKPSRKKVVQDEKISKDDLKASLRDKLKMKRLMRTSKFSRNREMDNIEDKLEDKRLPGKEKKRLKERMKLLEDVENKIVNTQNLDFPEYTDTASYGGGIEN